MRGVFVLSFALAAGPVTGPAAGASGVDFSGTWKWDGERSDPTASQGGTTGGAVAGAPATAGQGKGPGGSGGANVKVTQTAKDLRIEREGQGGALTLVYALDGSESRNRGPRGGELVSRSRWEGETLVTEGKQTLGGAAEPTIDFREVRHLEDGGKTMIVETTRLSANGQRARKMVYTKGQ